MLRWFPRPFDGTATKHSAFVQPAAVQVYRRLFLIYERMSHARESDHNFVEDAFWADVIYANRLIDVPKMLDLCALYGAQNMPLLSELLERVLQRQSRYFEDWTRAAARLQTSLNDIADRAEKVRCLFHVS